MNFCKQIFVLAVVTLFVETAIPAAAGDPTKSWWYRGTNWVDPTRKLLDSAANQPVRIPDPRYQTFKGSWNTGKFIAEKGRLGDRLYNYLERNNKRK